MVQDGTIDLRLNMKEGSRGEQLYDLRLLDRWWAVTNGVEDVKRRKRFSEIVQENNNFRVKPLLVHVANIDYYLTRQP